MDANTIVQFITPVVVPLIIAGFKKIAPKIPPLALPLIAPVLGALAGFLSQVLSHNQNNIWLAALLGLAGVGIREIVDQSKKVVTNADQDPHV